MQIILTEKEYHELKEAAKVDYNAELEAYKWKCAELQKEVDTYIAEKAIRINCSFRPVKVKRTFKEWFNSLYR